MTLLDELKHEARYRTSLCSFDLEFQFSFYTSYKILCFSLNNLLASCDEIFENNL